MEIYVQSRGYSPDFEYCWLPEVPSQLNNISRLIQSESPSVVLTRLNKQLMLLVTGLESPEKKDFRDRPIRHSVTWVCDDNYDNERQIRAIAVQALRGLLSDQIDKYIKFDGESGFEVLVTEFEKLSQSFLTEEVIESLPLPSLELVPKIGKNSQDLRDDLAYKLQQYSLPKTCEILIVATGIKAEESLAKAGIWRSLSNLVKSENWRDLPRMEAEKSNFGVAIAIIVAVIAIAVLLLLGILLHPFTQKPEVTPSPNPTVSPTNPAIEEILKQISSAKFPEPLKGLMKSERE